MKINLNIDFSFDLVPNLNQRKTCKILVEQPPVTSSQGFNHNTTWLSHGNVYGAYSAVVKQVI